MKRGVVALRCAFHQRHLIGRHDLAVQAALGPRAGTCLTLRLNSPRNARSTSTAGAFPRPDTHVIQDVRQVTAQSLHRTPQSARRERDDIFAALHVHLKDPARSSLSLSSLLDCVPRAAFDPELNKPWSRWVILDLLSRPADTASLLRLLPVIFATAERAPLQTSVEILAATVKRIRILRMAAVLPYIVDGFLARVQLAAANNETDQDRLMSMFDTFLRPFAGFAYATSIQVDPVHRRRLPGHINDQVCKTVQYLIDYLESLPASSNSPPLIRGRLRKYLFHRPFLTPQLLSLLLGHLPMRVLSPHALHRCAVMSVQEGMYDQAKEFMARKWALERGRSQVDVEMAAAEGLDTPSHMSDEVGDPNDKITELHRATTSADRMRDIERIILLRCGLSLEILVRKLEDQLRHQQVQDTAHEVNTQFFDTNVAAAPAAPKAGQRSRQAASTRTYAWSLLVHRFAMDRSTTPAQLLRLEDELVDDLTIPQIMTPLIQGLMQRGDLTSAWEIFQELQERQRDPAAELGRYLDRILLAEGTKLCSQLHGFEAALRLVDRWGERYRSKHHQHARAFSDLIAEETDRQPLQHPRIPLDAVNVNVLLDICRQHNKPSTALRIWAAALPRWGVWLDHISLNILLDCCRFYSSRRDDEEQSADEVFRNRLRDLVSGFRFRSQASVDGVDPSMDALAVFDSPALRQGDARSLLDPPGWTLRQATGGLEPWQLARQLFREIMFTNWSHLLSVNSPLQLSGSLTSLSAILSWDPPRMAFPSPVARYMHIIPSASSFQAYIGLLGHNELHDEIPLALAWARRLGVEPNWKSMCSALAFVCDHEGPRRWVRGWGPEGQTRLVRDEEILRRWLQSWVQGRVPTEEEVAAFLKKKMMKSQVGRQ